MIRLREAAAALVEDESIRLEWLNLEFRVAALAKGARYYPEPDSSIERLALSDAEGARLFFLRAQVIEEVLYRLRAGECPHGQGHRRRHLAQPVLLEVDGQPAVQAEAGRHRGGRRRRQERQ